MRNDHKSCGCVRNCPCYPRCDEKMDEMENRMKQAAMGNLRREGGQMGMSAAQEETLREEEADWMRLKEMYPEMARVILAEVERACDALEYEGSMMFDTMPDRERVLHMAEDIYDKVKENYPVEEIRDEDSVFVMNGDSRRRRPPKQNWLNDFVQVLLFQEMFHRRCRNRSCRRW